MPTPLETCCHCQARVSSKTTSLYGGLCRRCARRPSNVRARNLLFIGLAGLTGALWWWTNAEIVNAENNGGSFVAHTLLVAVYENSGRYGVNIIFFSSFLLTVLLAASSLIAGYNQVHAIRASLDHTPDTSGERG